MKILSQNYGKQRVRFLRTLRLPDRHDALEVSAGISLQGDFDSAYLSDDNSQVVATDTMKNTLLALAYDFRGPTAEEYALKVCRHFLAKYSHVHHVDLTLEERLWARCETANGPHPHCFEAAAPVPTVRARASRTQTSLHGGITNWHLMKTTDSGFVGFPRDEFTTLPETTDRILSSAISAEWLYAHTDCDFTAIRAAILPPMLEIFASQYSPSVQRTLFQMGTAALEATPDIASIHLAMPNKHYLPLDLTAFGAPPGQTTLWLPTDEPHGQIEATVVRP